MKLNFGQEVLVLPGSVLSNLHADAVHFRVLLLLASDLSLLQKPKQLAKLADCDEKQLQSVLNFWQDCGVLAASETEAVPVVAKITPAVQSEPSSPKKPLLHRADALPNYTSTEIAELLEKRANVRSLMTEVQQIIGKIFNFADVNILVGMLDYLGLCEESILLLFAHCKRIGKTNMRAIEKYAYKLVDRDILTPEALETEFRTVEALHTFEGQIRALFGLKSRALTVKEENMLRAWVSYGYDIEIVRLAYEITVNATHEASLPYTNSILERWNADGLHTKAEIERVLEEQKQAKEEKAKSAKNSKSAKSSKSATNGAPALGNSFDTDDFFEAALRRSFSESAGGN